MKIVEVTVEPVALPAQPVFSWRQGLPGSEPAVQGGRLRIVTADGLIGEAVTRRGVIVRDLVDRWVRDDLLGQDALAREHLWRRMWELDRREGFPTHALGLVDVALWDLAGKVTGLPVHRLIGTYRESIPAYASLVTYQSIDEYLDVVDQCLAAGFGAIKVHAWGDVARDTALARRLRAHVGDGVPLMYDGSAGFSLPEAVRLGRALSDEGFLWYEEPMREFNIMAHARLAGSVAVPLLVAETSAGAHMNTADFLCSVGASYVRTSPHLKGGITGALRVAHVAEAHLSNAEVHGSGLLQRHLCMSVPNTTYYESLVMGNPAMIEGCVGPDGCVSAPDEAGVGWGGRAGQEGLSRPADHQ